MYGGEGLDIVGQILATLQSGPYHQTAVVLVQNGALLLGTDLQTHLGFRLSQISGEGPAVELPKGNSHTETDNEKQLSLPVVRLLRLSAHHGHVMRACVDPQMGETGQLFVLLCDSKLEQGFEAEEGLVDDHTTTLILRNPTDITIQLMEGAILGELQSVKDGIREKPSQVVGKVLVGDSDKDNRTEELWQTQGVKEHSLSIVEKAQLRQVVEDLL